MAAAAVVVVVAEDLAVPLAVGEEEAVAVKVSSQKPLPKFVCSISLSSFECFKCLKLFMML